MRFGSTAKVLAKCMLKYYRISECCGMCLHPLWLMGIATGHRAMLATLAP